IQTSHPPLPNRRMTIREQNERLWNVARPASKNPSLGVSGKGVSAPVTFLMIIAGTNLQLALANFSAADRYALDLCAWVRFVKSTPASTTARSPVVFR